MCANGCHIYLLMCMGKSGSKCLVLHITFYGLANFSVFFLVYQLQLCVATVIRKFELVMEKSYEYNELWLGRGRIGDATHSKIQE